jgi:hypothetical protein
MKIVLTSLIGALALVFLNEARAEGPATIPPEVVESWSTIIGNWSIEGQVGTVAVTGSASFEWAADKHCYVGQQVWHVGPEGRVVHLGLIGGWDAAMNETVEQGFSSASDSATVRYSTRGPSEVAGGLKGNVAGNTGSGRRWSGTIEREQHGPNEFTLTSTVDGDVVHSFRYVRVEREGRSDSESSERSRQ